MHMMHLVGRQLQKLRTTVARQECGIGYAARNERDGGRQCARVFEMVCTLQSRRATERDSDARAYRVVLETMQLEIQLKLYGYGYITTSANGSTQTPNRSIDAKWTVSCIFKQIRTDMCFLQSISAGFKYIYKNYEKLRFGIRTNFMYSPSSLSRSYARFQKKQCKANKRQHQGFQQTGTHMLHYNVSTHMQCNFIAFMRTASRKPTAAVVVVVVCVVAVRCLR